MEKEKWACSECMFFSSAKKVPGQSWTVGFCVRSAPVASESKRGQWPSVLSRECCGDFKRNGSNIKTPTPNWPAGCEHMRFHEFQNAMGESALECPEVKAALRALIEEVKKMRTSIGGV